MKQLLIVDDHFLGVQGITEILKGHVDYKVVATARNGNEALEQLKLHTIQVVILDIEMGEEGPDGLEVCRTICAEYPSTAVLMLSMHNSEAYISEVMNLGQERTKPEKGKKAGVGFMLKDKSDKDELIKALDALSSGENYYGVEVMDIIVKSWAAGGTSKAPKAERSVADQLSLTKRERQVLALIAQGLSGPDIAERLFIAGSTVESHRRALIYKAEVANTKELIRFAIKNGLDEETD